MTSYAPSMPHHTAADLACRESAALRRRMTEGAWQNDAATRLSTFYAAEVLELLPPPVISRNAALQVWSQTATLYDDEPTVSAPGAPDTAPVITPDLWPMRQQCHLLQVAANEALMRVDLEAGAIQYRSVPADVVVLRGYTKRPAAPAPFNPTRTQPARVEECRLRVSPSGVGEIWTWEAWDITDPEAPVFQIWGLTEQADGKGRGDTWTDLTLHYTGEPGWPAAYRDATGRPILPYVLYHRRVGDHLRDPESGRELVAGTLDASCLWTFWFGAVRDSSTPLRYIIDGDVPATSTSSAGTGFSSDMVRAAPQVILQINGKRRGDAYSSPSAGQFQPGVDPASLGAAIEANEAGLAASSGINPADVHRGSASSSGYALVVSAKGQRDAQKKLIPPSRSGDQILLAKAAALLESPDLPIDPALWSVTYGMIGTTPEDVLKEQEVIKGDLELGLTSRRAAITRRNPTLTPAEIDALIAEIEAEKEGPDAESAADEDADLRAALNEARAALASGDTAAAAAAMTRAAALLEADADEDAEEEMDAEEMPPGSDNAS